MSEENLSSPRIRHGEDEMKIWHLDRVLTVLENRIRKLEAERTQIRSKAELAENMHTTWSKTLFTGASLAAPIILGL